MYSLGFISNFIISLMLLSQCILVALENWVAMIEGGGYIITVDSQLPGLDP